MAKDIEEFLKMAAKRRQQQKKPGNKPAQPAPPASQQRPPVAKKSAKPLRPPLDQEVLVIGDTASKPKDDPYDDSVAKHVREYIDTTSLGEQASHLGQKVALADDKLDARLHQKFDHDVGRLKIGNSAQSTTTTTTAKAVAPLAKDLLQMLSSPGSIRQAILINEVLRRPNFD